MDATSLSVGSYWAALRRLADIAPNPSPRLYSSLSTLANPDKDPVQFTVQAYRLHGVLMGAQGIRESLIPSSLENLPTDPHIDPLSYSPEAIIALAQSGQLTKKGPPPYGAQAISDFVDRVGSPVFRRNLDGLSHRNGILGMSKLYGRLIATQHGHDWEKHKETIVHASRAIAEHLAWEYKLGVASDLPPSALYNGFQLRCIPQYITFEGWLLGLSEYWKNIGQSGNAAILEKKEKTLQARIFRDRSINEAVAEPEKLVSQFPTRKPKAIPKKGLPKKEGPQDYEINLRVLTEGIYDYDTSELTVGGPGALPESVEVVFASLALSEFIPNASPHIRNLISEKLLETLKKPNLKYILLAEVIFLLGHFKEPRVEVALRKILESTPDEGIRREVEEALKTSPPSAESRHEWLEIS